MNMLTNFRAARQDPGKSLLVLLKLFAWSFVLLPIAFLAIAFMAETRVTQMTGSTLLILVWSGVIFSELCRIYKIAHAHR